MPFSLQKKIHHTTIRSIGLPAMPEHAQPKKGASDFSLLGSSSACKKS